MSLKLGDLFSQAAHFDIRQKKTAEHVGGAKFLFSLLLGDFSGNTFFLQRGHEVLIVEISRHVE